MAKLSEINREKILELKKKNGDLVIASSDLNKCMDQCGVWVMLDENDVLLEVGQSADIGSELEQDLGSLIMRYPKDGPDMEPVYKARRLLPFNEPFYVCKCDSGRTAAKYRVIAQNSQEIKVYRILENRALDSSKTVREEIEMEIAVESRALFWNAFGHQRKLARAYYA